MNVEKLTEHGCDVEKKEKVCRSRGGESCAFDGAMIVLQPIADTAHIVHGPIACAGNSWEGRGAFSSHGELHRMGFTTDMSEMDIVYGSDEKLYNAIIQTYESVKPKAIFVYSTCVSGLIGEDIEAICKKAEVALNGGLGVKGQNQLENASLTHKSTIEHRQSPIRVVPVNAPGFVGPKNLGNRIAGEVLLDTVIGTGEPGYSTERDINLIGEYNIAGDLWLVEPLLKDAGVRVLSRITGDATFDEITYAHHAQLNLVVCSRALINVAREMERRYGIPYVEVSFFGKTEMAKALRAIGRSLAEQNRDATIESNVDAVIAKEEARLAKRLRRYAHLKGMRAVLYTGGVKSWSLISALRDLGIEVVAVGTKKSTFEDEEKMRGLLGESVPLVEDVTATNLLRLMDEGRADMLIAGGRNQYLAAKEGIPFVDVNQERHIPYAGYDGLVNLAEQISNSVTFFARQQVDGGNRLSGVGSQRAAHSDRVVTDRSLASRDVSINPLKHSPTLGAAIAFQGIHNALPIIHGAQGCGFLGKVLLTKHFREPVALASTKLFTEDVVMGSDETLTAVVEAFVAKSSPDLVGILSSALSEVKGDDVSSTVKALSGRVRGKGENQATGPERSGLRSPAIVHVATPDYGGGLEQGYARAVEAVLRLTEGALFEVRNAQSIERQVNVLAGGHLTPADFTELREVIESFGLSPVILPDLAALDGSRREFSALATGGTTVDEIRAMGLSRFTLAVGASMEPAAQFLKDRFGIVYRVFEGLSGLRDTDMLMETLASISSCPIPAKYERQRRILIDGMRDAHFYYGGKKACLALEPDLAAQVSRWLYEMGMDVELAVVPAPPTLADNILAHKIVIGDLSSVNGGFDILISNSHAENAARRLGVPLYQIGFPTYKVLANNSRVSIGYRGTLATVNEVANLLIAYY